MGKPFCRCERRRRVNRRASTILAVKHRRRIRSHRKQAVRLIIEKGKAQDTSLVQSSRVASLARSPVRRARSCAREHACLTVAFGAPPPALRLHLDFRRVDNVAADAARAHHARELDEFRFGRRHVHHPHEETADVEPLQVVDPVGGEVLLA
eukprot:6195677-Pleurochrysis_carterae.AAC.1